MNQGKGESKNKELQGKIKKIAPISESLLCTPSSVCGTVCYVWSGMSFLKMENNEVRVQAAVLLNAANVAFLFG